MLRTTIISQSNTISLTLPDNLVGRKVEVIAFAIEETEPMEEPVVETKLKPSQLRGFLSVATAEAMQQHLEQSRNEWNTF